MKVSIASVGWGKRSEPQQFLCGIRGIRKRAVMFPNPLRITLSNLKEEREGDVAQDYALEDALTRKFGCVLLVSRLIIAVLTSKRRKQMFAKRMLLTLFVLFFAKTAMAESFEPFIFINLAGESGQGNLIYSYVQRDVLERKKCEELDISPYAETHIIECTGDRLIGSKGQELVIIVKHPPSYTDVRVSFKETSRETKISSDIEVLKELVTVFFKDPGTQYTTVKYVLTKERANLKVSVSYNSSEQPSLSHDIITGPKEHLFLSADLPVKKVSQLKYDSATNSLQEKDSPTAFFLGVNAMIGDVISEHLSWSDRIFAKAMLKVSSRPLDSFGVAVGYRLPALNQLSVFAGYVWVKEDVIESGVPKEDEKYKGTTQFGISYNLDKALGWAKK